jgi:hypothetical protein
MTQAFWGMIIIVAIISPIIVYICLKKFTNLKTLACKCWINAYWLAFIFFPLFIFRKHWEFAWKNFWYANSTSYLEAFLKVGIVVQMVNNLFENVGKLFPMLILVGIFLNEVKPYFEKKRSALTLGFWFGLCYGCGEALSLTFGRVFPGLAQIFGFPSLANPVIGWFNVYVRGLATYMHGVMGALIGLGLYFWYKQRSWFKLLLFLFFAMLYQLIVDAFFNLPSFFEKFPWVMEPRINFVLLYLGFAILGIGFVLILGRGYKKEEKTISSGV